VRQRRSSRVIAWTAAGILALVVALIVLLAVRTGSTGTTFESPLVGHAAPATSGATLTGAHFDLSSERGHVVVVNFFASWCGPCQEEQTQLNAFAYDQSQKTNGATMLGVVFNDRNQAALTFAQNQGVTYPLLTDEGGQIAATWGVASPPTTYVVDATGTVVKAFVGPLTAKVLDQVVAPYTEANSNG